MNSNNNKYDPNVVIATANAAPDLDSGRFIFQSALLEWVDDAREGGAQLQDGAGEQIREAVATLWLALAQYLMQSKQFKSATETLDEAVQCPVASAVGRVHAEAARFAVERGRRKTAQTIYANALVHNNTVTDEQDRELLWHDFLELMRETNPQLTLTALQEAVEREAAQQQTLEESPATKRTKRSDSFEQQQQQQRAESTVSSRTHVVTLESVEQAAHGLWDKVQGDTVTLPPEIMAAWMSRDGNYPPQPPEHAIFAPSPPKLSDPVRNKQRELVDPLKIYVLTYMLSFSSSPNDPYYTDGERYLGRGHGGAIGGALTGTLRKFDAGSMSCFVGIAGIPGTGLWGWSLGASGSNLVGTARTVGK